MSGWMGRCAPYLAVRHSKHDRQHWPQAQVDLLTNSYRIAPNKACIFVHLQAWSWA